MITNTIGTARASVGLTQQQLADILGWTLRKLTSYERGERVPPLSEALRLATVLGVPVEGLWSLE